MRRGRSVTRSPSPKAHSQASGPSLSPSSLWAASWARSLLDSLSTAWEGKNNEQNLFLNLKK